MIAWRHVCGPIPSQRAVRTITKTRYTHDDHTLRQHKHNRATSPCALVLDSTDCFIWREQVLNKINRYNCEVFIDFSVFPDTTDKKQQLKIKTFDYLSKSCRHVSGSKMKQTLSGTSHLPDIFGTIKNKREDLSVMKLMVLIEIMKKSQNKTQAIVNVNCPLKRTYEQESKGQKGTWGVFQQWWGPRWVWFNYFFFIFGGGWSVQASFLTCVRVSEHISPNVQKRFQK